MNDFWIAATVVGLLVLIAAMVAIRKGLQASRTIEKICQRRGWQWHPGLLGYGKVTGREAGIPWELELSHGSDSDRTRRDDAFATFSFQDARVPPGTLIVTREPSLSLLTKGVMGAMAKVAMKAAGQPLDMSLPTLDVSHYGLSAPYVAMGDAAIAKQILPAAALLPGEADDTSLLVSAGKVSISYANYTPGRFAENMEMLADRGVRVIRELSNPPARHAKG
jgi:hypothetical protein